MYHQENENPIYVRHTYWMTQALMAAEAAAQAGEVPVGAVVVNAGGEAVAIAENRRERDKDPTAHAEILALRQAGIALQTWHLQDCTLYVTLEPCPMCAGALVLARLGTLVYGADDLKAGCVRSVLNLPDSAASNHKVEVIGGILETPSRALLQRWFQQKRKAGKLT